jgi:hypothetical protein
LIKKEKMWSVNQSVTSVIATTAHGDDRVHYVRAVSMSPIMFEMEALKMEVMVVVF